MSKRLIATLATCAALAAAPAMADPGHGRGFYRQPPARVVVKQRTVIYPAPRVVYRSAPRVVYARPAYYPAPVVAYAPPPVYVGYGGHHGHHDDDAWKWVAGGALVGAILYGIDH